MNRIHWIIVYMFIINFCVTAKGGRGSGGGGSRGGGRSRGGGGRFRAHSPGGSLSGSRSRLRAGSRVLIFGRPIAGSHGEDYYESHEESHTQEPPSYSHLTKSLTHFTYHPPDYINFTCHNCSSSVLYPVYKPMLPTYVFACKESRSRYRDVLAGLCLYNLARTTLTVGNYSRHYMPRSSESCSLQIIEFSHFEEMEFPCFMISTFIEPAPTTNVNDSSLIDITLLQIDVSPFLMDNNSAIEVTNEQECVIWYNLTIVKEARVHHFSCALLKEYANSLTESGIPAYIWLPVLVLSVMVSCIGCVWYREKRSKKIIRSTNLSRTTVF
ncbi:uncharacterized protein LOC124631476 isoform X2 [Helicoverpa zea]|uniref:uncharacterized protein LOC124631476 isoform X2 n=1 Tax=Helicoverpa zea TaxID=7113 RepID=UPI001F57F381|nr:uncharacterized protein LOC124631476 isoform X2 [Helicoverpa zea]